MTIRNYSKIMVIAALSILLPGCGLTFISQEIHFRHAASQDQLDILLIYQGVTATSDSIKDQLDQAIEQATQILSGHRVFNILHPIFTFDFEKVAADESLSEEIRRVFECVAVEAYGSFLDDQDRLCLFQKVLISNLTAVLGRVNEEISKLVLKELKKDENQKKEVDEQTLELWKKAATSSGFQWVKLEKGIFEVNLPLSNEEKNKQLKDILQDICSSKDKDDIDSLFNFFSAVRSISYMDEQLTVRFGHGEDKPWKFKNNRNVKYTQVLRNNLENKGFLPDPDLDLEKLRMSFTSADCMEKNQ